MLGNVLCGFASRKNPRENRVRLKILRVRVSSSVMVSSRLLSTICRDKTVWIRFFTFFFFFFFSARRALSMTCRGSWKLQWCSDCYQVQDQEGDWEEWLGCFSAKGDWERTCRHWQQQGQGRGRGAAATKRYPPVVATDVVWVETIRPFYSRAPFGQPWQQSIWQGQECGLSDHFTAISQFHHAWDAWRIAGKALLRFLLFW